MMYVDDATLEQIEDILHRLVGSMGIETAVVVGLYGPMDGVMLTVGTPHVPDENELGYSVTEIVRIAQKMSVKLGRGSMEQVTIKPDNDRTIFINPILDVACLAVVGGGVPFGLIWSNMDWAIEQIVDLLSS